MLNLLKARFCAALVLIVLAGGCSSSGTMTMKQPLAQQLTPGKSAVMIVDIKPPTTAEEDDYREVRSLLRDQLYDKLLTEGIFKKIFLTHEPADYRMDILVTGARKVSVAARFWGGVMAGPNVAEASVNLNELQGNTLVTSFQVEGTSAAHPLSGESSLEDAVREAVAKIILGLEKK